MQKKILIIYAISLIFINPAFAAGGLSNVNTILTNVSDALHAAAIVTVTIALFWAGYKVLFQGQTLREVAPILLGGILIGGATEIANMLVG